MGALINWFEIGAAAGEVVAMPGIGRIAHCQDNQGVEFSLFMPESEEQ